eukprot:jgi/Mesvir1/21619/Mv04042-RA.1
MSDDQDSAGASGGRLVHQITHFHAAISRGFLHFPRKVVVTHASHLDQKKKSTLMGTAMANARLPHGRMLVAIAVTLALIVTVNADSGADCSSAIRLPVKTQTVEGTTMSRSSMETIPCSCSCGAADNETTYNTWYRLKLEGPTVATMFQVTSSVNATWSAVQSSTESPCEALRCLALRAPGLDGGISINGFLYLVVSTGTVKADFTLNITIYEEDFPYYGATLCTQPIMENFQQALEGVVAQIPPCNASFAIDTSDPQRCPSASITDPCPCMFPLSEFLEMSGLKVGPVYEFCPKLRGLLGMCPARRYQALADQCGLGRRLNAMLSDGNLGTCQSAFTGMVVDQMYYGMTYDWRTSLGPCEADASSLSWYRLKLDKGGVYPIQVFSPYEGARVYLYASDDGSCDGLTCLSRKGFATKIVRLKKGVYYLAVSTGDLRAPFSLSVGSIGGPLKAKASRESAEPFNAPEGIISGGLGWGFGA